MHMQYLNDRNGNRHCYRITQIAALLACNATIFIGSPLYERPLGH